MKRISFHILFWLAYTIQDAFLEYLWLGPSLKAIPENIQLLKAFEAVVVLLIPKLLFTYFVMYFAINRILAEKNKLFLIAFEIFIVLLATIFLYRVVFNYYVYPHIYSGIIKTRPLLDGRLVLLGLMDIGFVSGAAISFKLLRKQLAGKEREKSLVKEKLEAELKFLRNQTNPHFLFNTLNNIYGMARVRSEQTAEAVMKLSKLLRFMIYESNKEFISVGDEIKMLEDYIELEKIRYNNRLSISFNKEIDDFSRPVIPLLLLPLIENAFKHGASESRFNSFIHIYIELAGGRLNFEIENSKENGVTDHAIDNIGLSNLRRQLELIYRDYALNVNNESTIFRVFLNINLDSYAKV